MKLIRQLAVLVFVGVVVFGFGALFMYDVIKLEWISFMEVQESFKAAEDPLPVPARSVPMQGVAYLIDEAGDILIPENPVEADNSSVERGAIFYEYNCKMCHGDQGDGKGSLAVFLIDVKPADLTSALVQEQSDGELFLTLTNGKGMMPYMTENLTVRDRWDVVNYIRTLQAEVTEE